jgi:hypothetical protein
MKCASCGLSNFENATTCRRCGGNALVSSRPPPPSAPIFPAQVDGEAVTVSKEAAWPARCVKCGTHADLGWRDQRYLWFPSWTYCLLVFGLVPAAIIQWMLTKRAGFTHAICKDCSARWSFARALYSSAFCVPVFGGLALVVAGVMKNSLDLIGLGGALLFPGLVIFPVAAYWLVLRPRIVRAVFIDDYVVTLAGVARPVRDELIART